MEIDLHNKKLSYLKKLSLEFHRSQDCLIQLTNQITKFLSNPDQSEQNKHDFSKSYINQYQPFLLQRPHMAASVEPLGGPLKLGTKSARMASCILIHVTNITSII